MEKGELSFRIMYDESEIVKRIRKFRIRSGLTLQQLAEKTGFTQGYLSKVENSKKSPPVSTLIMIAKALNVTLSDIFGDKNIKSEICVVKKHQRREMARNGSNFGYSYETLAHTFFNKHMDPYILTIPERTSKEVVFQHKGEEFLFVLEGKLKFYHGESEFILEEGDCVYFNSGIPHGGIRLGEKAVKVLVVIYTPE